MTDDCRWCQFVYWPLGLAFWPAMIWYFGLWNVLAAILVGAVAFLPMALLSWAGQALTRGR